MEELKRKEDIRAVEKALQKEAQEIAESGFVKHGADFNNKKLKISISLEQFYRLSKCSPLDFVRIFLVVARFKYLGEAKDIEEIEFDTLTAKVVCKQIIKKFITNAKQSEANAKTYAENHRK